MCFLPLLYTLFVTRAVTGNDLDKFLPVDFTKRVVPGFFVKLQIGIRNADAKELSLLHSDVNKFLPQLVVTESFDFPRHRLRRVLRLGIVRAEHHQ